MEMEMEMELSYKMFRTRVRIRVPACKLLDFIKIQGGCCSRKDVVTMRTSTTNH